MAELVIIPSASRAPLLMRCSGSAVLPRCRSIGEPMAMGLAGHEHLQLRTTLGIDSAVAAMPDTFRRHDLTEVQCAILRRKLLDFEWVPPAGSLTEVFLCMRQDGSVTRHETPLGHYPKDIPDSAQMTATIDLMWSEVDGQPVAFDWITSTNGQPARPICPPNSVLWVVDWKFGRIDGQTEAIESNRQLEICALLGGRWTRAKHVIPAVIYPGKGRGTWDVPARALARPDALEIEERIRKLGRSIWGQRQRIKDGDPLHLVEGPHCTYCPSQWVCPAKTAMIKAAIAEVPQKLQENALTPEQAARGAEILPQLKQFVGRLQAALRQHVEATGSPIELIDGKVWGPNPHRMTDLDPDVVEAVLREEIGEDAARSVITRVVSRSKIEEAAHEFLAKKEHPSPVAPLVRKLFGKIKERGGISEHDETWWSAYRPTQQLPVINLDEEEIEDLEGP
jgi:hypothetical protein